MFALIQDGTPIPPDSRLELLGRLPEPESLLLLGRRDHTFRSFSRGASIGIGPHGSGTAHLMRQLFDDRDLREYHDLREQAQLLAEGKLDVAAFVMQENAELLRTLIREYSLDIVAPQDFQDRYQQSMIDEAITTLATLFQRAPSAAKLPAGSVAGLNPSKFDPDGSGKLHATDGRIGCEIQA